MLENEPYIQEVNINYLKNISTFKYETIGNGHISDFFRREEHQINQKFERSYSIQASDEEIEIPINGLGNIDKIMVLTPRFKSVKLHFIYDDFWEGKKEFIQYFTDYSVLSLDSKETAYLSKLKISTKETLPFRADIHLYSFTPGVLAT